MDRASFRKLYLERIQSLARDGDVNPRPFFALLRDGSFQDQMLMLGGKATLDHVEAFMQDNDWAAVAYGFDRFTLPDQGTTRTSVYTWTIVYGDEIEHGIVEYDAGTHVDEPCTDNLFWNANMEKWWREIRPKALVDA